MGNCGNLSHVHTEPGNFENGVLVFHPHYNTLAFPDCFPEDSRLHLNATKPLKSPIKYAQAMCVDMHMLNARLWARSHDNLCFQRAHFFLPTLQSQTTVFKSTHVGEFSKSPL